MSDSGAAKNVRKALTQSDYRQLLDSLSVVRGVADGSHNVIPKFFQSVPSDNDLLRQKLREEARALLLQKKSRDLLDNDDLQTLTELLENAKSPPFDCNEQLINYNDFCAVRDKAPPKLRPYFAAGCFIKLINADPYGRISVIQFLNYVMRKLWLQQTRIGLSLYDTIGQGYLRETELENYIVELIPTLPQLDSLEKTFYSFYVCTAVRKFFFFLDPLRTGRVKICDILVSGFLDDLLELRDESASKEAQKQNWFSASSALRVYGQYLNLDKDHDGMLSKEELGGYGTGSLTPLFLDRLFQEGVTYEGGKMDYKSYLDFVLAMENKRTPQALQYLFRLLDLDHKGYLTLFDINYFFKAIQQMMRSLGQEVVAFKDIQDEIFDMVKPKRADRITLADLLNCAQGDVVISNLIDLHGFWNYENREFLITDTSQEAAV